MNNIPEKAWIELIVACDITYEMFVPEQNKTQKIEAAYDFACRKWTAFDGEFALIKRKGLSPEHATHRRVVDAEIARMRSKNRETSSHSDVLFVAI